MAQQGVAIDLKESKKSVEQALRELKVIMDEDMIRLKENRYYVKPTTKRREKKKTKRNNIRRYNKYR